MPIRRSLMIVAILLGLVLFFPVTANANAGLLWQDGGARALVPPRSETATTVHTSSPSLFADRSGNSMFRPVAARSAPAALALSGTQTSIGRLLDLIASAEAGRDGYDAVVWAATIKPARRPTDMTVGEIYQWITATPNQHHAIGRYQFIPSTLRRLVQQTGAGADQRFTPAFQDQLAILLLEEAGLKKFQSRDLGRAAFMNNLAKIWAGLPTTTGRSHYHGVAGNRATLTWDHFNAEMAAIFPL